LTSAGAGWRKPERTSTPPQKRHGIVSGIIIPPYFCQPPAVLNCDKSLCVGPVLSVPDSSAPSPPGSSGSGLSHEFNPHLGPPRVGPFSFWGFVISGRGRDDR